jgi:hypothetical protein
MFLVKTKLGLKKIKLMGAGTNARKHPTPGYCIEFKVAHPTPGYCIEFKGCV